MGKPGIRGTFRAVAFATFIAAVHFVHPVEYEASLFMIDTGVECVHVEFCHSIASRIPSLDGASFEAVELTFTVQRDRTMVRVKVCEWMAKQSSQGGAIEFDEHWIVGRGTTGSGQF